MLAPVLARLTAIPGIVAARVECSGTYFLVTGYDRAALAAALPLVPAVLGAGARCIEGTDRAVQLATVSRGELWFSNDDIRALSYVEGRIFAARMLDAVGDAVPLGAHGERVLEAVRVEIFAALDHAHDTGGRSSTGWFWRAWPRIVDRIADRLSPLLADPELQARIDAALRAQAPDPRSS